MYDNGLLQFYKTHSYQDGFLDATPLGLIKTDRSVCKVTKCLTNYGSFYQKVNGHFGEINKSGADAEILLSQIYNKAGIKSAVYIPAQIKGNRFLLCDDVETEKVISASDYLDMRKQDHILKYRDFLNPEHKQREVRRFFTRKAMAEQTKMRIYDIACHHTDRHFANFFYTLQRDDEQVRTIQSHQEGLHDNRTYPEMVTPEIMPFRKPCWVKVVADKVREAHQNKANGVVAIDFESSGYNVNNHLHPNPGIPFFDYITDFEKPLMPRQDALEEIQTNPELETLVDKHQLAEEIGSINPVAVAEDIKQTIGYEVDPKYADFLQASFDHMAETLSQ